MRSQDQENYPVQKKIMAQCRPRNVRFNQQQPTEKKKVKSNSILKKKSKYSESRSHPRRREKQVREHSFRQDMKSFNEQSCENPLLNNESINEFQMIKKRTSAKRKFEDANFPPVMSSLFPFLSKDRGFQSNLKWMRISEIFKGRNIMLWNPSKLTQNLTSGSDFCPSYLVQALNCLRTSPKFLSVLFDDQVPNQNGVYYVKIFINSHWKVVIIDDYIPVIETFVNSVATYQPIFTDIQKRNSGAFSNKSIKFKRTQTGNISKNNEYRSSEAAEIWMFLVQKALAKIYSSYEAMTIGNFFDLLTQLTGYDMQKKDLRVIHLDQEENEVNWKQFFSTKKREIIVMGEKLNEKKIHEMERKQSMKKDIMNGELSLSSKFSSKDPMNVELPLSTKFSEKNPMIVIQEFSSNTSQSGRQRALSNNRRTQHNSMNPLLKKFAAITPLRGRGQKLYFYSTSQSDRLIHKNAIWPDDIKIFFSKIFVWGNCTYNYWGFNKIHQLKDKIIVRRFTLKQSSQTSVSVYQRDRRFFGRKGQYEYSWMRLIILLREFNGSYRWIGGDYKKRKTVNIQQFLQHGEYYVLMIPEWKNRAFDLNFVLKTSLPTKIEKVMYEKGIFEEGCADLAQRYGRMNQLNKNICSYNCIHEEMGLIIENINNQKTYGVAKIRRMISNLKSQHEIEPFNEEFNEKNVLEVNIACESYYTVVLMMKGGIDKNFFQQFNFSL